MQETFIKEKSVLVSRILLMYYNSLYIFLLLIASSVVRYESNLCWLYFLLPSYKDKTEV